jgi:hypothetical protein
LDVTWLNPVLDGGEPSTTVTVDVTATDEAGPQQRELRWRELRRQLEADGAPPADLAAIDEVLSRPVDAGGELTQYVAARAGRVVLEELLIEGAPNGIGSALTGPVVDVLPLLRYRARHAPVVVMHADRAGADIEVFTAAEGPVLDRASTHGSTEHIRKVQVGGWRHSHYQRVSENVWRANAEEAAAQARRLLQVNSATMVLVSGDVRARQLIAEALPEEIPALQVEAETRPEGASNAPVDLALTRSLDELAARAEDEAVQRWRAVHEDERTHERATADLPSTVAAVRQGQVEELLIVPGALRPRHLLIGPAGSDLALPGSPTLWGEQSRRAPADLALVRAAAATGAQVQLVELESAALPDGVAARLRWSMDEAPGTSREDDQ